MVAACQGYAQFAFHPSPSEARVHHVCVSHVCDRMAGLQVGDIGVVSFGDTVDMLHPLGTPFNADAGARVLSRFSFSHESTRTALALGHINHMLATAKDSLRASAARLESAAVYLVVPDRLPPMSTLSCLFAIPRVGPVN